MSGIGGARRRVSMSWRSARREVTGAARSVRYDLGRHDRASRDDDQLVAGWAQAGPTRRRLLTAVVVALLFAGAVTGTYFAAAGGLGALLSGRDATPPGGVGGVLASASASSPSSATWYEQRRSSGHRAVTVAVDRHEWTSAPGHIDEDLGYADSVATGNPTRMYRLPGTDDDSDTRSDHGSTDPVAILIRPI